MHKSSEKVEALEVFIHDTAMRLLLLRFFSRTYMIEVLKLLVDTYLQIGERGTVVVYCWFYPIYWQLGGQVIESGKWLHKALVENLFKKASQFSFKSQCINMLISSLRHQKKKVVIQEKCSYEDACYRIWTATTTNMALDFLWFPEVLLPLPPM